VSQTETGSKPFLTPTLIWFPEFKIKKWYQKFSVDSSFIFSSLELAEEVERATG
jgi:hypothetical protein